MVQISMYIFVFLLKLFIFQLLSFTFQDMSAVSLSYVT